MTRWLPTLAAAAAIALAGVAPGRAQTATPTTPAQTDRPATRPGTKPAKTAARKTRRAYRYGRIYLTAYTPAGRQAKAGKFGRRLRLGLEASKDRRRGRRGRLVAGRTEAVSYCGKTYWVTRRGTGWIEAHRKAGHVLVVRKHVARKKFSVLCGKKPKRVKRRAVRKRKSVKKTTGKKS